MAKSGRYRGVSPYLDMMRLDRLMISRARVRTAFYNARSGVVGRVPWWNEGHRGG